jgi:hypothetical protein
MQDQDTRPWPFPVVNGKRQASPAPVLALPPANPYPDRTPMQALIQAPDYHFLDEFTEDDAPL